MVMADLFLEAGIRPGIAHCNFCLRGEESDGDEQFVRAYATKNGLTYYTISFDTEGYAAENHLSIQMAARDLRYGWFEKIRKDNAYDKIAVAHNLNDNIRNSFAQPHKGNRPDRTFGDQTISRPYHTPSSLCHKGRNNPVFRRKINRLQGRQVKRPDKVHKKQNTS
jgi:tRNA(Ile)-lysidine synthase TilS/MesJ